MVSTRNTSKSHVNPSRMQDQPGGVDSRPPEGALETVQVNTGEVEALRLTNQRLIEELENSPGRYNAYENRDKPRKVIKPPLRKSSRTSALPEKQKQSPAELGGMDPTYPPEGSATKQYPGETSGTISRPLLNKEWRSNHGNIDSRVSNRSSAT